MLTKIESRDILEKMLENDDLSYSKRDALKTALLCINAVIALGDELNRLDKIYRLNFKDLKF